MQDKPWQKAIEACVRMRAGLHKAHWHKYIFIHCGRAGLRIY